uniref:Uncharacterized protein n=1 Tax=Timema cristinae TaxID=61476 RepID=A0A7R9CWL6_TIMCR|nr:unnamed protein product [Timema cristinae]
MSSSGSLLCSILRGPTEQPDSINETTEIFQDASGFSHMSARRRAKGLENHTNILWACIVLQSVRVEFEIMIHDLFYDSLEL